MREKVAQWLVTLCARPWYTSGTSEPPVLAYDVFLVDTSPHLPHPWGTRPTSFASPAQTGPNGTIDQLALLTVTRDSGERRCGDGVGGECVGGCVLGGDLRRDGLCEEGICVEA